MVSEKEQNLLNLIDQDQSDIIQCLQKLISFKTITPQDDEIAKGEDYKELQNYIANIIKPIGFEVETWEVDASTLPTFPGSGVKKDRDLRIGYAIVDLMKQRDDIENFNKKAIYILIREMTDVETAHITSVVNVLKKHYKKITNTYHKTGTIIHNFSGSFF